ncbi:Hypothetical protein, putative [Bodo saltans]|uniref:Uncharacterized protein n=1 Tax=Bodo saltans TaxID=75058 RepID=A0A0S4JAG4_BODSA|nr:Hypothetical protein, putative [Bodo saltans]|eukprot:CUG86975.1 Hypothetical protein, putative [Bodo saltans]
MPVGTSPAKRSVGASSLQANAALLQSTDAKPAISAHDSTSPEDREAILRLIHHLSVLMKEIHTPYLDGLVMEKYVIRPLLAFAEAATADEVHDQNDTAGADDIHSRGEMFFSAQDAASARDAALANVVALVNLITDHKQRTLEVLEAVSKREHAWTNLQSALASTAASQSNNGLINGQDPSDANGGSGENVGEQPNPQQDNAAQLQLPRPVYNPNFNGSSGTGAKYQGAAVTTVSVEAAAMVQHHMFLLQKSSLAVVEHVQAWRRGLALPHPFMVGTENYLLKMLQQTSELAQDAAMMAIIPMQSLFYTYPLCSNIPSLGRYAEDPTKANFRASGASSTRGSHPYGPVCDSSTTKRLQLAEKDLVDEVEVQVHLVQQLVELCQHGRFLPVLNLRSVFPKAYGGALSGNAAKHHHNHNVTSASSSMAGKTAQSTGALRGIPLRNPSLQRKLEVQLLHALDVLRAPAFRPMYDEKQQQQRNQQKQAN